jgi:hypothetical protein
MTEFEMAYLLTDMQAAISTGSSELITLVTGFLVAGYTVGHRLSRWMLAVVLGIFGYWYSMSVFILSRQILSLGGLVQEIHSFAESGKGLQWHVAAGQIPPSWLVQDVTPVALNIVFITVFAAAIAFFLQCRRMNRKAEVGAWKPKA